MGKVVRQSSLILDPGILETMLMYSNLPRIQVSPMLDFQRDVLKMNLGLISLAVSLTALELTYLKKFGHNLRCKVTEKLVGNLSKKEIHMSFGAILKMVGKDVLKGLGIAASVEQTLGPILQVVLPAPIAAVTKIIDSAVMTAEATVTTVNAGVAKKESATQIIVDEIPNVESILSVYGPNIV